MMRLARFDRASVVVSVGVFLGVVLGVATGAAATAPPAYLAGALVSVAAAVAFLSVQTKSELLVALYWFTFVAMSSFFIEQAIDRLFYPFYAVFGLSVVIGLIRGGLRFEARTAWIYGTMLALLIVSLIGYEGSLSPTGLNMMILYVFGALVMLQVRSVRGSRVIFRAAVVASLAVSAWIIGSAVQTGFSYRGGVGLDQNVLSFFVGVGFVAILSAWLHPPANRRRMRALGLAALLAIMLYALLLLASRGLLLAVGLATATMFLREAIREPRKLGRLALVIAFLALSLALPGGRGVLERFSDPGATTAGGRTLIWSVVLSEFAASSPQQLAIGHGFGAARKLVENHFTWLGATHNAYLQVVFDLGIVGLIVFLALHLPIWQRGWSCPGSAGAHLVGTVTFLLAANLTINAPDNFLYWTALGWLLGTAQWCGPERDVDHTATVRR